MEKTFKNLKIIAGFESQLLSISENRKNNLAVASSNSGRLQSRSVPQRIGQCRKADSSTRGLRKSSSLTNGMSRPETTISSESMALRPEVLSVLNRVNASILDKSAEAPSMVARRMS